MLVGLISRRVHYSRVFYEISNADCTPRVYFSGTNIINFAPRKEEILMRLTRGYQMDGRYEARDKGNSQYEVPTSIVERLWI